ncbi:MAG TPA: hypothetical protein VIF57_18100 [Polyangia bacterium]|jgi:hypothetical protein
MLEITRTTFARRIVSTAFAVALGVASASAFAGTTQRPISDFLSTQGTFCVDDGAGGCTIFVPPTPNFVGFTDTVHDLGISFDYAGLSEVPLGGTLGTTFDGSVSERTVKDGSVIVTVHLHTSNALVYVIPFDPTSSENQFGENQLLFGTRVTDVQAGAQPALGDSNFTLEFTNAAPGLPIPDFEQLLFAPGPGQSILSVVFEGSASGQFANGTPGKVHVIERGIFHNGFHGAVADGFPAEFINFTQQ